MAAHRESTPGRYELAGRGSDLGLLVSGPDLGACLSAAVAGVADSLTEGGWDVQPELEEVLVEGEGPEDLLVGRVDEIILRLDADGRLAVGLVIDEVTETGLRGELRLVPLEAVEISGVAPKAATWHGVRLGPRGAGWEGEIMLDL